GGAVDSAYLVSRAGDGSCPAATWSGGSAERGDVLRAGDRSTDPGIERDGAGLGGGAAGCAATGRGFDDRAFGQGGRSGADSGATDSRDASGLRCGVGADAGASAGRAARGRGSTGLLAVEAAAVAVAAATLVAARPCVESGSLLRSGRAGR